MTVPSRARTGETLSEISIEAAVLPLPDGFEMLDGAAVTDRRQHLVFLGLAIRRNDQPDRSSDDFVGGVAEHLLGGAIPRLHDPVQVLADDRVL